MATASYKPMDPPTLSEKTFQALSEFIHTQYGIKMPPEKKLMLQSRLQRRLRTLGYTSFDEYSQYVFSSKGENEVVHMIDRVTTNKTDFFREPGHFDFLVEDLLPKWLDKYSNHPNRRFSIWSAGCSTGEEPYTLAMILSEYQSKNPKFNFRILATDLSTKVLQAAQDAIYDESRIVPIPMVMRKKYLLKSKDRSKTLVRIVPEIRSKVSFSRLNFMDDHFGIREKFDIIFCRNVIIYFNRQTQEILLNKFAHYLQPKGYLFLGHSETINGINVPFATVAPTVYRKH